MLNNFKFKKYNFLISSDITYYIVSLILLISFIIRYYFRSYYLDNWDSVQFALALEDYSLAKHQPHPFGFPVYIFINRFFDIFINNHAFTLTLVSAIFGTLTLACLFLLSKKLFDTRVAILSVIILSLTPEHLLSSEVAMSDIVSLFFLILNIYLLFLGLESTKYLYFASFLIGFSAGIRWNDIIIVSLLFLVLYWKKNARDAAISISLTTAGILFWLIPIIIDAGVNQFINVNSAHWQNQMMEYSTLSSFGGVGAFSLIKTFLVLNLLLIAGWSYSYIFFIIISLALLFTIMKNKGAFGAIKLEHKHILILAWILVYILFSMFVYALYLPRYLLPIFPALAMLFGFFMLKLIDLINKRYRAVLIFIYILIIIFMAFNSLTLAYGLHQTAPAPVKAAQYIKTHYNSGNVIIFAMDSFRHFQYYLPTYEVYLHPFRKNANVKEIKKYLAENKTILSDKPMTFYQKYFEFERKFNNKKVYPKHYYSRLYEYRPATLNNSILMASGFFDIELWDGNPTRWMEEEGTLLINAPYKQIISLKFLAKSFNKSRMLHIYANHRQVTKIQINETIFTLINESIPLNSGLNEIKLHLQEGCEKPSENPDLNNPDSRCLGMAIQKLSSA